MKTLDLIRNSYNPVMGTFGSLEGEGFSCVTVERPWAQNQHSISCIPEGTYQCIRGVRPKHGECFEITNVPGRTAILIHAGNTTNDVEGCIALGNKYGVVDSRWAVMESSMGVDAAYNRFMRFMEGTHEFTLRVRRSDV